MLKKVKRALKKHDCEYATALMGLISTCGDQLPAAKIKRSTWKAMTARVGHCRRHRRAR
jgi:hypothetical protein